MLEFQTLLLIENDGIVRLSHQDKILFEAKEKKNILTGKFTETSGIRTKFNLTGSRTGNNFNFSGHGELYFGKTLFNDASVIVSPAGILISIPLSPTAEFEPLSITLGQDEPHTWRVFIKLKESLACSVIKSPEFCVSLVCNVLFGEGFSDIKATALFNEEKLDIALNGELDELLTEGHEKFRRILLDAVAIKLIKEISRLEGSLAVYTEEIIAAEPTTAAQTSDLHAKVSGGLSVPIGYVGRRAIHKGYVGGVAKGYINDKNVSKGYVGSLSIPPKGYLSKGYIGGITVNESGADEEFGSYNEQAANPLDLPSVTRDYQDDFSFHEVEEQLSFDENYLQLTANNENDYESIAYRILYYKDIFYAIKKLILRDY